MLKKKSWSLNENLSLHLEYGVIDLLSVQIPLLSLHKGQVNVFIDNVTIVLSLHLRDHSNSDDDSDGHHQVHENLNSDLKMVSQHILNFSSCIIHIVHDGLV